MSKVSLSTMKTNIYTESSPQVATAGATASSDSSGLTPTPSNHNIAKNDRDVVQSILASASAVLDVAAELAPLLPVPFVATIFISAKGIVDSAAVRSNF
jgi:hypothetical protein